MLAIDHFSENYYPEDFFVEAKIKIIWKSSDNQLHEKTANLKINHSNQKGSITTDKDAVTFDGGHWVKTEIIEIHCNTGEVPENVFIESSVQIERFYDFNPDQQINHITSNASNGFIDLTWEHIPGAEAYQVEWCFFSSLSHDMSYDFGHQASQITVTQPSAKIPVSWEAGTTIFRIRALSYFAPGFEKVRYGAWTIPLTKGSTLMINHNNKKFTDFSTLPKKTNWLLSFSPIMPNESFVQVTFIDGLGRNRQAKGSNNAANCFVASESFYDGAGRLAITTLPFPDGNSIGFHDKMCLNHENEPYSSFDFDVAGSFCQPLTGQMSTKSGPSRYFSPENQDQEGIQAYVACADSFPFVRTIYSPSPEGEVSSTFLAGSEFAPGTSREKAVYQVSLNSKEMDKLLGTECGYEQFYNQKIVKDENGQYYSVISNSAGLPVVTHLCGNAPENLQTLPEFQATTNDTIHLLNGVYENSPQQNSAEKFFVEKEAEYTFYYEFSPAQFSDTCLKNKCLECNYEIMISVLNSCRTEMLPSGPFRIEFNLENLIADCRDTIIRVQLQTWLPIGQYTAIRSISSITVPAKVTTAWDSISLCKLTYPDFFGPAIDSINTDGCFITYCEMECLKSLGTLADHLAGGGTESEYSRLFDECTQECAAQNFCKNLRSALEADMWPGAQYAEFIDTINVQVNPSVFPYSVLNENNQLPQTNANWRHPALPYLDLNDQPALLRNQAGQMVAPEHSSISLPEFINAFIPSFAASLVPYHPEYCYYEGCVAHPDLFSVNSAIHNTPTQQQAIAAQYYPVVANDPLFSVSTNSEQDLLDTLLHFRTLDTKSFSLWDLCLAGVLCPQCTTAQEITYMLAQNPAPAACITDQAWLAYREKLISLRLLLINDQLKQDCPSSANFNYFNKIKRFNIVNDYDSHIYTLQESCDASCENAANAWLEEYAECLAPGDTATIHCLLRDICKSGCSISHPAGTCNSQSGVSCNGFTFQRFDEVIAHFSNPNCEATGLSFPPFLESNGFEMDSCGMISVPPCITCKEFANALTTLNINDFTAVDENETTNLLNRYFNQQFEWDDYLAFSIKCNDTSKDAVLCPGETEEAPTLNPCVEFLGTIAAGNAAAAYQQYKDNLTDYLLSEYHRQCSNIEGREEFYLIKQGFSYQYTLQYFDLLGNRIKTVPPNGIRKFTAQSDIDQVKSKRGTSNVYAPNHELVTRYFYNSANQVVATDLPDGKDTRYVYDNAGR
ncbi:MAG: hypothetical protein KKA07_10805, partial [Bacteroidetes bacterium]|nr:hypothetical protein [Bacteroidota bacterium]